MVLEHHQDHIGKIFYNHYYQIKHVLLFYIANASSFQIMYNTEVIGIYTNKWVLKPIDYEKYTIKDDDYPIHVITNKNQIISGNFIVFY